MTGVLVALRGLLDGARLLHVHGQRLFHHHRYMARGARLHHPDVRVRIGEGRDGFRLRRVEHLVEIGVELIAAEVVRPGVFCQQFGIGIPNRDDDDIGRAALRVCAEIR